MEIGSQHVSNQVPFFFTKSSRNPCLDARQHQKFGDRHHARHVRVAAASYDVRQSGSLHSRAFEMRTNAHLFFGRPPGRVRVQEKKILKKNEPVYFLKNTKTNKN